MELIVQLSDYIEDEICDARKYAELALMCKDEYPEIAQLAERLSNEGMGHMKLLHDGVSGLIAKVRDKYGEPDALVMKVYNRDHKKHINSSAEVYGLQAQFKG